MIKYIVFVLILANMAFAASLSGPQCALCSALVMEAQSLLANNATDEAILEFFEDRLCSKLGAVAPICKGLIVAEGPAIIAAIRSSNPQQICTKLNLCVSNKMSSPLEDLPITCEMCLYAVQLIDGGLSQNKTQEVITKDLQKFCNLFQAPLKNQCISFVNEYGPFVIEMIATDISPQKACRLIKLCN